MINQLLEIDKWKFLKLIRLSNRLNDEGFWLYDIDPDTFNELNVFIGHLRDQVTYQRKRLLIKLLERLENDQISLTGFITAYQQISEFIDKDYSSIYKDDEQIIILQFRKEAEGFQKEIISNIYLACEQVQYPFTDSYYLNECDFRTYISDLLFEVRTYQYN